jgi:hypothetical protein
MDHPLVDSHRSEDFHYRIFVAVIHLSRIYVKPYCPNHLIVWGLFAVPINAQSSASDVLSIFRRKRPGGFTSILLIRLERRDNQKIREVPEQNSQRQRREAPATAWFISVSE